MVLPMGLLDTDFIFSMKEQITFNQLLTWFLSRKSLHLDQEGPWIVSLLAKSISFSYQALPSAEFDLQNVTLSIDKLEQQDYQGEDTQYLEPILKLQHFVNSQIKNNVVDFLVHGSLSTLDYAKGWSDLDTLVIINNETLKDPQTLIELREKLITAYDYLLKIDPLQHHGFIYCTEFDLNQYLSHCMPIEVIKESKSLIKNTQLSIHHKREQQAMVRFFKQKIVLLKNTFEEGVLRHHAYDGKYLLDNFEDTDTMYQMKYFLSTVMSLPIFFLDAIGEPCYKKESFEQVKSYFGHEWEIIVKASNIRSKWPMIEAHPYQGNKIPHWLCEELGDSYFERAYTLGKSMSEKLTTLVT